MLCSWKTVKIIPWLVAKPCYSDNFSKDASMCRTSWTGPAFGPHLPFPCTEDGILLTSEAQFPPAAFLLPGDLVGETEQSPSHRQNSCPLAHCPIPKGHVPNWTLSIWAFSSGHVSYQIRQILHNVRGQCTAWYVRKTDLQKVCGSWGDNEEEDLRIDSSAVYRAWE